MNPISSRQKGDRMNTTDIDIGEVVFNFSGQTELNTWKLHDQFYEAGWAEYSDWLVKELPFCLQMIKDLSEAFPYWQHTPKTGRPPIPERILMIGYLLKQLFRLTYRQTEAMMVFCKEYFQFRNVPDHTTLSLKNRTKRWSVVWKRFHKWLLDRLPKRKSIIATDATGFSGRKKPWRETDYGIRANQNWVKLHAAVETNSHLILSYQLSPSNVHESQMLEDVWNDIPSNIIAIRSLADSAYTNEMNICVAKEYGATPYHGVKKNAVYRHHPETNYEKMVNFATHWPNRFQREFGQRNQVESAFNSVQSRFDYRIRCRTETARKNEVLAKINSHNIRMLARIMHHGAI